MSLSRAEIHAMAAPWLPDSRKEAPLSIHTDTSDFFRIESGDVVLLAGAPYLIRKKAFAYIPDSLNRVLLHFSKGAHWFYEHTEQLLHDLSGAVADIR
jgi:hypothetical protein